MGAAFGKHQRTGLRRLGRGQRAGLDPRHLRLCLFFVGPSSSPIGKPPPDLAPWLAFSVTATLGTRRPSRSTTTTSIAAGRFFGDGCDAQADIAIGRMRFQLGPSRRHLARDIGDRGFQDQRCGIERGVADAKRDLQRQAASSSWP